MSTENERMDALIRGARTSRMPSGDPRPDATEAQLAIAQVYGIPDGAAHRLRGDSTEALRDDALALARAAASAGGWADPPAPPVSFDGGARGTAYVYVDPEQQAQEWFGKLLDDYRMHRHLPHGGARPW